MAHDNIRLLSIPQPSAERASLSPREVQAVELAGAGLSNAAIGECMGCSENTARAFLRTAAMKLGTSGRTEAAIELMRIRTKEAAVLVWGEQRAA